MNNIGTLQSAVIEPIPENLVAEPIEFLFADHYRQRQVCNQLEQLVRSSVSQDTSAVASQVRTYLTMDMPLHIADEQLDFFPRLLIRCQVAPDIQATLANLQSARQSGDAATETILLSLDSIIAGRRPHDTIRFLIAVAIYTERKRRHVTYENGVLLPLARRYLDEFDLRQIGRSMAARRGIAFPD